MAKRSIDEDGLSQPLKRVQFDPINIGPISSMDDFDVKILQIQNKKLAQILTQRNSLEAELKNRIEQLEKRQTKDDSVLNLVNRYWNQLNEDIRILLQRFDAEIVDEIESKNESEATTSFLVQLSTWDKEELDEKLANRVQVSKNVVAKLIQVFDRLVQRNNKITLALKGELEGEVSCVDDIVRQANIELQAENQKLQNCITTLHEKYHTMSLKVAGIQDVLNSKETAVAEMQNQIEELQYEHQKTLDRNYKLETNLAESKDKLKRFESMQIDIDASQLDPANKLSKLSLKKVEELQKDNDEIKELSNNRLQELEELNEKYKKSLVEVETYKMKLKNIPKSVIVETAEYKTLQSQLSVLVNETALLKSQLIEANNLLKTTKNHHLNQIEVMESEELIAQKKLRTELMNIVDVNLQLREEFSKLRMENEQTVAVNEGTKPVNKEMRTLLASLQSHNNQLKSELQRCKLKTNNANDEILKLKKELEDCKLVLGEVFDIAAQDSNKRFVELLKETKCEVNEDYLSSQVNRLKDGLEERPQLIGEKTKVVENADTKNANEKQKNEQQSTSTTPDAAMTVQQKNVALNTENELYSDIKMQLKKALQDQKETKLLLDMYKEKCKDQKEKVQLLAAEKKLQIELEDVKQVLKNIQLKIIKNFDIKTENQGNNHEDNKQIVDGNALQKIKTLEEQIDQLQKQVTTNKQEEEAMLIEMEVTGKAFEDMQEQNIGLTQQLAEKDIAYFKLMEKCANLNNLLTAVRADGGTQKELADVYRHEIDLVNDVLRKLEQKECILQSSLRIVENECSIRQEAMEMYKQKATESAQAAADLKLHLDECRAQTKEAQQVVVEKISAFEAETFKTKRLQEEIIELKRKTERMSTVEQTGTLDEVLMEEIKDYKETLTCPSCKVKKKDAVLTKCFHVFCWDCLRTRYETRRRKCPKCNAAFGVNDYHRLYLES